MSAIISITISMSEMSHAINTTNIPLPELADTPNINAINPINPRNDRDGLTYDSTVPRIDQIAIAPTILTTCMVPDCPPNALIIILRIEPSTSVVNRDTTISIISIPTPSKLLPPSPAKKLPSPKIIAMTPASIALIRIIIIQEFRNSGGSTAAH